ncbi:MULTISPECIES: eCIS core domain-containing protein [Cyanophyceae]|uniref:eCIS core domain-containing protein n=1 Tax=Cyanophyceae TaxID=3028117 RepID=UPI0018EF5F36|nr:DUF4157 domain-containing protein [Trichocoleus sp. FACHB-69]
MNTERYTQKKASANSSTTPAPIGQFAPRPFPVQTKAVEVAPPEQNTLNSQTKTDQDKPIGFDFAKISISAPGKSTPSVIQPKFAFGRTKPDVQRHSEEDELQMKPDVQRHSEEDELQMKPDVQRQSEEEDELQMKPDVQRQSEEEDELQMKPDVQRHSEEEEDELQMKPDVQRHSEEDELQMKPQVQRQSEEEDELQMKPQVQRQSEEEDELQMKPQVQRQSEEEDELQMKPQVQRSGKGGSFDASNDLESRINSHKGGGSPLPDAVRSFMEPRFGHSFAHVRVHTDNAAVQMNRELHAQAFTNGNHIFYGPDKSPGNLELTAHELTHTIQQTGGSKLQRQSADCQCQSCTSISPTIQRQITFKQSGGTQDFLGSKLTSLVQRQGETTTCSTGCQCSTCNNVAPIQRQVEAGSHSSGCQCSSCNTAMPIQTKLTVGAVGDQYEQEADRVAAEVMKMPEPKPPESIQRHEEKELAQTKPIWNSITPIVQKHEEKDKLAQTKPISAANTPTVQQSVNSDVIQKHSSWEHQLLGDAKPDELAQIGSWQNLIDKTRLTGTYGWRKREMEEAEVNVPGVASPIKKGNVMHVLAQELQRLNEWQNNPPKEASSGEIDPKYQTVLVSIPGGGKDGEPLIITYGEMNTLADYYGNLDTMKTADPKVRWTLIQSVRQETFFRLKDIYSQLEGSLTDTEKTDKNVQDAEAMMKGNERVNQKLGYKFKDAILQDYISGVPGQINLLTVTGSGAKGNTNEYGATLARNACHFVPESWHAWSGYHQQAREAAKKAWDLQQRAETAKEAAAKIYGVLSSSGEEQTDSQAEYHKNLEEAEQAEQAAKESANEALLNNGFGDHYLQDSYAAGHMINKTQIMQWFVQWLDTQSWTMDFASAETWHKIQQIAYKQPGLAASIYDKSQVQGADATQTTNRAKNPQAVEDIKGDDWKVRFDALGLQVPASLQTPGSRERTLMEWWQTQAMSNTSALEQTQASLLSNSPLKDATSLNSALTNLVNDRIVRFDKKTFAADKYILPTEYMPKDQEKFKSALAASKGDATTPGDDTQYQRMAAAVTYQDYLEFLNNAYLQKSTNALHNVFCENGIKVYDGASNQLFRVYGDDAMFNKDSAIGVKHSGETANMSRDAIRNIIKLGNDGGITTQNILTRLPNSVQPDGASAPVDIATWHHPTRQDQLKAYCEKTVFPSMGIADKFVALKGSASSGMSNFISKDKEKVHGSEAF